MNHYQVEFYFGNEYIEYISTYLGVELGEISTRFAHIAGDNGYLRLNNVRIPRTQMLMKLAQVELNLKNENSIEC